MQITILKDTPFDVKNTILDIVIFRAKYGYMATKDVTNEELFSHLIDERNLYKEFPIKNALGEWFEPISKT